MTEECFDALGHVEALSFCIICDKCNATLVAWTEAIAGASILSDSGGQSPADSR